ncbi:extensin family protein [Microvirga aerophila]|uniref:Extensin-like C-terminal domain-containing protein n=1 Tax=Microvirga aerophila TaxID=670291 RepID=A0A512BSS6_9HYPH|nr:extensin family protein [Microvirga aerophila]GEO15043.1 hypothetical protein MAE02_27390 [Microvirga aerophila]
MRLDPRRKASWVGILFAPMLAFTSLHAAEDASGPPLPPPRPDRTPAPMEPQANQGASTAPTQTDAESEESAKAARECADRLTKLGVRFETRPAVQENACSIKGPVLVSSLPDDVAVSPASLMTCSAAESLAKWTREVLLAEADRHFQTKPTKILIGTSYQCRNQRSGAKLSEHAFGNGLDIMGFEFAKRSALTIGTHADGSPEAAFQAAVRAGACPIFTTVLGPGSDAAHGDHLHVDMRERKGDYRICQ